MTWQEVLQKAPPLNDEDKSKIVEMMKFGNMSREEAERKYRRKTNKLGSRKKAIGRFAKSAKKKLLGNQKKIAEQAPPKDEITGEDFKALRDMKKSKRRSAFTQED